MVLGFITGVSTFSRQYTDLLNVPTDIVSATGVGASEFLQYNGSSYVGIYYPQELGEYNQLWSHTPLTTIQLV